MDGRRLEVRSPKFKVEVERGKGNDDSKSSVVVGRGESQKLSAGNFFKYLLTVASSLEVAVSKFRKYSSEVSKSESRGPIRDATVRCRSREDLEIAER